MSKLGPFELDSVVCGNSYELIKQLPDKCIDLIYTDIPYLYNQGGSGSSELGQRTAKKRLELMTIKPLQIVEKHILHASQEGAVVFDPFIGSGTTAVACKNNNRHYLGIEINEKWAKIAQDRLNNTDATGQYSMFTV